MSHLQEAPAPVGPDTAPLLNNALKLITGYAALLRDDAALPERQRCHAANIAVTAEVLRRHLAA